jgi:hypothetical protein
VGIRGTILNLGAKCSLIVPVVFSNSGTAANYHALNYFEGEQP